MVVQEAEFGRTNLPALVGDLLRDLSRRRLMAGALKSMARPEATRLVGQCIESLLLHPHARGAALMAGNSR